MLKELTDEGGLMFFVPGTARARRSGTRQVYKSGEEVDYMETVGWCAMVAARANGSEWVKKHIPMGGPLIFGVAIFRQMPATNKPDLSNYVKMFEDALNRVIYRDDAQIVGYLAGTRKESSHLEGARIAVYPAENAPLLHDIKM